MRVSGMDGPRHVEENHIQNHISKAGGNWSRRIGVGI